MARLSEHQKESIPASKKAIPGKGGTGSYPMPDVKHARAALGFAAMHHGKNSATYRKVKKKAASLGFGKGPASENT